MGVIATCFDDTPCELGEGPFWHPIRKQYFWFDILAKRLHTNRDGNSVLWQFDEFVSAAGVIDSDRLLIASQTQLFVFDLKDTSQTLICELEADNPITRSNDSRTDTCGGFWIGTMGINSEPQAGAIYRFYSGELRLLFSGLTTPNAICFSPDGNFAFFADTPTRKIMRTELATADGWPVGEPEIWLDLSPDGLNPDGAIVDAAGNLWNAQWGAARVACYAPDGALLRTIETEATQSTCPAFGGPNITDILITSAWTRLIQPDNVGKTKDGMTFLAKDVAKGQPETLVKL